MGDDAPPLDPAAMRSRIDAVADAPTPEAKNPKQQRIYPFPFRYENGGKVYEGTFTNKILNVGDRMRAGALFADLTHQRPVDALPGRVVQLAQAISWMTYSLTVKGRPTWAADLASIEDEHLIFALFGEVWDHQTTFLGGSSNTEPKALA